MSYVTTTGKVTFYIRATGETIDAFKDHGAIARPSATGYGSKVPTCLKVNYQGRARRVYQDVHSNAARTYILVNGNKLCLA